MLEDVVESHKKIFKDVSTGGGADRSYFDKKRIKEIEQKNKILLGIPHKKKSNKYVLSKGREKLNHLRIAIEAKISEGKRMCGLDKSYYHGFEGDKIWTSLSVMALNMKQLIRDVNRQPKLMVRFGYG